MRVLIILICISITDGQNFQWSNAQDNQKPWPLNQDNSRSHQDAIQQQQVVQSGPGGQQQFGSVGNQFGSNPNQFGPGAQGQPGFGSPNQFGPGGQNQVGPGGQNQFGPGSNQFGPANQGQLAPASPNQFGPGTNQFGSGNQLGPSNQNQFSPNFQNQQPQGGPNVQPQPTNIQQAGQQIQRLGEKVVDLAEQGRQRIGQQLQQFGQQIQQPANQILPGQIGQQIQQGLGQGTQFIGQQISPNSQSGPSWQGNSAGTFQNQNWQQSNANVGINPQSQPGPAGSNPQWGPLSSQPIGANGPQWFGDPNRPPDSQQWQQVGPSIQTSADKTIMIGGSPWNNQQAAPAGWGNNQLPPWQRSGQPAGSFSPNWQGNQNIQAPFQQQQLLSPGQQQNWNNQWQQQQQQFGAPPIWQPGQQGWITNPPAFTQASITIPSISTTPAMDDNTEEILRDLVAYHIGGAFPRDEVRQYNAKVPMPRQHRDYWLGDLYYNLDPASQLQGKIKCTYNLPSIMNRLHYDDGQPIHVVVFQCVLYQERCCNLDCCNLYAKTIPPQQPFRYYAGGVAYNYVHCYMFIILLINLRLSF